MYQYLTCITFSQYYKNKICLIRDRPSIGILSYQHYLRTITRRKLFSREKRGFYDLLLTIVSDLRLTKLIKMFLKLFWQKTRFARVPRMPPPTHKFEIFNRRFENGLGANNTKIEQNDKQCFVCVVLLVFFLFFVGFF